MAHPTDIPAVQMALAAILPDDVPEEVQEAIVAAQMMVSVVPQCGAVLDALKGKEADLDLKASQLLAGVTYLMLHNGFLQRQAEAYPAHMAALARIAALEA